MREVLVLAFFALIAGAGTAVSPCVLPVLPALLSAAGSGGRRRPLGVVTGLTVTFTVTIVGLSSVVDGVGLGDSFTRDIAIVALLGFGAVVLVPKLADRVEAPLSRLARFGPQQTGDGFVSGLGVGAALGFVYAPCAGPILAAVIAVSAATGKTVVVGFAYAVGSAAVLFALALGGRGLLDRVRRGGRGAQVQQALGAVMVLTAVAMVFSLDTRFQTAIANHLPNAVVNPTEGLEKSSAVKKRLADLRGKSRFEVAQERADKTASATPVALAATDGAVTGSSDATPTPSQAGAGGGPGLPGVTTPKLAKLGDAPDFAGDGHWFNTADGRPLTMASLRGKVVLIDFWTYTCINCIRTLPYLKAWDAKYRSKGLVIVGVHSPEFDFEKKTSNVAAAIRQNKLRYPVVQDNDLKTWNAWGNQYWPAEYLVDAKGQVRRAHFGEGEYKQSEAAIRALLAERGDKDLGAGATATGTISVSKGQITPETYLGTARAQGWVPSGPLDGPHDYRAATGADLPLNSFSYGGQWAIDKESATARRAATIDVHFLAQHVYLVLSSRGGTARTVGVTLDGAPRSGVTVTGQRLYTMVDLPAPGEHELHLKLPPGVTGYAFTFG
ncbi:cytochrome c biogenesis protein DipZ [Paraconexibacter antarcticus]|uniref:Cytochrome c biogenesis protein DipZ n=1 Tax=Paraconexibacter antarcticus TaxID=2949664 RepID=A0ABY5DWW6_9ACTN|nr:cytochrome c biogenesis protein DipZ [Paraconexibacter antarcticus]UTI65995.1 cytochrome c biogenesis protein DipZ [Paraconexibacter antarcticus]